MGIYIRPCDSDVRVWADADFSGKWFQEETKDGSEMARSCSVFLNCILYVRLCVSCNFRHRYPSDILIFSTFYSVKHYASLFLS